MVNFHLVTGLGGIDLSSIDSDARTQFVAFLESVFGDVVPRGVKVVVARLGDENTTRNIRRLQGCDGSVPVVFEVTLVVLCSPEEACADAEAAMLQAAEDVSSDVVTATDSISATIDSAAADGDITALDGFSGVTCIEASDPVAIVTFRSDEPSS